MRTVLNSTSRADSERSPLHDVKQHAHCQASLAGANLFTCGRAKRAIASAARHFLRRHSLGAPPRQEKPCAGSLSRNGCRPEASKPPASSCQTTKPARAADRRIVLVVGKTSPTHRIVTADLVEPDGIEPTTSCLQSRRSPN